jgi:hypothetical protein
MMVEKFLPVRKKFLCESSVIMLSSKKWGQQDALALGSLPRFIVLL